MELDPDVPERMAAAHEVVLAYLSDGRPAYGLTTGLGALVVDAVAPSAAAEFSRLTVLGRANAVGPGLPSDVVRAALLVRAAGLARGGSGARPEVVHALLALLEHGVHPVVPAFGSTGASDICMLAHVGLVLLGEGDAEVDGQTLPGERALDRTGLAPIVLGPKDGLALISASAFSAAFAALALVDARELLGALQVAAALSMEGFRANPSPLDERVVAARPAPGQAECAAGLRTLLAGSAAGTRRLQDPLSFRCVSQTHGSLATALEWLADALEPELNGAADNPLVLSESGEMVSTGNFFAPALTVAADAVALALAQVATLASSRVARLMSATLTDLPQNLAPPGSTGTGMAPLLKPADALAAAIAHGAAPATLAFRRATDGVEDAATGTPLATGRLGELRDRLGLLVALELVVAAQAVDLAGIERLGAGTAAAHAAVRALAPPLREDRPLGRDVDSVAAKLEAVVGAARRAVPRAGTEPG